MKSPLETRLEFELRSSKDPVAQAVLSAQIACYLARVGDFEEAERRRMELRAAFGDGRSAQVSILIMCLEALILFFRDLDSSARDRLLRANILSVACRERALVALTNAWLAHIDFNAGRYEAMARSMNSCSEFLEWDDGTASCRLALVLGDAFVYAGHELAARKWYDDARITASRLGDQAAVGAITYNRAALHVSNARLRRLSTAISRSELTLIDGEVRSAVNYQAVAGLSSLDHLLRSTSVGALMLADLHADASKAILSLIASAAVPSGSAELALLYSDNAHCLARLGSFELASQMADAANSLSPEGFDSDDRALLFDGLACFCELVGKDSEAKAYRVRAASALAEHQATITELTRLLQPFAPGPTRPTTA
jgi:hypothetical protein